MDKLFNRKFKPIHFYGDDLQKSIVNEPQPLQPLPKIKPVVDRNNRTYKWVGV